MKEIVKCSGYYCLILQLHVLASLLVRFLLEFIIAFFVENEVLFLTIEMIAGLGAELFLCAYFIKTQIGKQTTAREIFLPFFIAIGLHFFIALINKFYIYTAGVPANAAAHIWETIVRGESVVMADIAFWRRIVTFIPMQIFLVAAAYLGFRKGQREQKSN